MAALTTSWLLGQADDGPISKRGTTAASILEIPIGARALAMGNAQSASANDGSSFYWNPALPARVKNTKIFISYMPWLAGTDYSHFALTLPLPGRFVFGAYITSWTMDDMLVRTEERPEGTGEKFNAADLVIGLSLARSLTTKFSIGATAKVIQERIWHSSAWGAAIDFGTLYLADIGKGLKISAVISNYGSDMRLRGQDGGLVADPDPSSEGNNGQIPANYEMDGWALPLYFRFGLASDLIRTASFRITTEVDAIHPSNNYPGLDLGMELALYERLFLRTGYSNLFIEGSEEGLSLGAGVRVGLVGGTSLAVDYGYKDFGRLGYLQAITLDAVF